MLASFLVASALGTSPVAPISEVFACSWVATEQDDPFYLDVVVLRAVRDRGEDGESWSLEWADDRTARARAYPIEPGQFGERARLEWSDGDGVKRAFVSRLPAYEEGREMVFISMDERKQDGPPGYVCLTAPPEESVR